MEMETEEAELSLVSTTEEGTENKSENIDLTPSNPVRDHEVTKTADIEGGSLTTEKPDCSESLTSTQEEIKSDDDNNSISVSASANITIAQNTENEVGKETIESPALALPSNDTKTTNGDEASVMQIEMEEDTDTGQCVTDKLDETPPADEQESSVNASYYYWRYDIHADKPPKCMAQTSRDEFKSGKSGSKKANFLKGCKWAPDGSCLLSCSDDDTLRLFNFPSSFSAIQDWNSCDDADDSNQEDWKSVLKIKEGGLIYDYCWYPLMSSVDPASCCLLTTSSLSPIHLWDAFDGKLRATYHPYNHLDQVISAYSIAFGTNGETIYSGFEKFVRIFNIARPGRECVERKLKQPVSELNQYGIIASIAVNPSLQSFYALGSFDKSIGLYYDDGTVICLLQGHTGGVTHMKFSNDGMKLFTGGRKDSRLMCWDMRQLGEAYKIYERVVSTHQRVYFDVSADERYLVTGGTDGVVKIWDLQKDEEQPCCTFRGNTDCVNGASLNPYVPLLATTSGQRHFPEIIEDSDEEDLFSNTKASRESSCDIKLWKLT